MAGDIPKDPAALWREMVVQWEQGVNALATQVMGTGEFSRDMNKMMGVSLRLQKSTQELLGRYFDALNLPTKDDLKGLGERLQSIEEQLGRVAAAIERLAGPGDAAALGAAPRVARTKRFRGEEAPKPRLPRLAARGPTLAQSASAFATKFSGRSSAPSKASNTSLRRSRPSGSPLSMSCTGAGRSEWCITRR